ncbi:hypothetical protein N7520_000764 [Penicillium odoratum]|uniref:uncharacterized protein n=1 Tax=Penicillium odoratum TaxID=1167516 RepID=UPI002546A26D|nr:uncharacterized protein N7520_000764 [Penicillium odoratum]KAJ5777518.1 hypothetical protein N7520_000764 [Penicillium odoratum]
MHTTINHNVRSLYINTQRTSQKNCEIRHILGYRPVANAIENSSDNEAPTGDEQPNSSFLSSDITLNALAQLGVFRLGCNRSFVSIIDRDSQFIIAEATKSVSLRITDQHLPGDGVYLGARRLDLEWGVCPHTISLFTGKDPSFVIDTANITANRSRYIIRDFTKEDCFKDRPYVREWPHMRFYAEVPLFSPSGYVLGSYCVVDDSPREEFGDTEVDLLQEISDAIGLHLENTRVVHNHHRAEKLVKGLTSFVQDYAEFDPREVSSDHRLQSTTQDFESDLPDGSDERPMTISLPDRSKVGDGPALLSSLTTPSEEPSSLFLHGSATTTEHTSMNSNPSDRPFPSPGDEKSFNDAMNPKAFNAASQNSMLSLTDRIPMFDRITTIFARASGLLKDSMDLDGVVFLDAARCNPSFLPPEEQGSWEPLPKRAGSYQIVPSGSTDPLCTPTLEVDATSEILGSSLKTQALDVLDGPIAVPEKLLSLLVTNFPQGQIFHITGPEDNESHPVSSPPQAVEMVSQHLGRILPGAKSVLFCPLWDYHKSRWMAGTLVWSQDSHRPIELNELHYFKVFGDSIVSEIARIHWSTTEKTKFDFISSVSHELRSPLHGILASAELLNTTSLEPVQGEMINMIESSGHTLLDTTDQLLAFCKINTSAKTKKLRKEQQTPPEVSDLIADFDLGELVEEVTNILYTGQRASGAAPAAASNLPSRNTVKNTDPSQMSVIVRIQQCVPWNIRSQAGAWRRIVMNLLGNSIKWTETGFIEVSLSQSKTQPDSQSILTHLSVTDTGSGIEPDFLRHKLFSAFTQEDPLTEGVGLGLSIVRLLVTSLGGNITVKSEVGIGTQVDVYIPVQSVTQEPSAFDGAGSITRQPPPPQLHACLVAFNGYPELAEAPTGLLTAEAKRKLSIQSNLADVFMSRFGWGVSLVESFDKVQGDIAVIEEATLHAATGTQSLEEVALDFGVKLFIILGKKKSSRIAEGSNIVRVSEPFGPQKIIRAIQRILESHEAQLSEPAPAPACVSLDEEIPVPAPVPATESEEETTPKGLTEVETSFLGLANPCPVTNEPKTVHVLVVDDNDINVKIMATFLHKIGCSYETASNGLLALEKYMASKRPYDFVLMDISMPVMDGLVSTKKIRQYEKEMGLFPSCIMAVTGVASDAMQEQAMAVGINDYLIKPLSLKKLKLTMGFE